VQCGQANVLNGMFADLSKPAASNRSEGYFEASQTYLKLAFKAQNQARMTLETLSTIKNPPVVYAKQANIANGPQQVNNGTAVPLRAKENQNQPNKLLEAAHEQHMDTGASTASGASDKAMATLGEIDGTADA
jgi:hypothetical protein